VLPLVETFFAQRIFSPMRPEKLERQLLAQRRSTEQGPPPFSSASAKASATSTSASAARSKPSSAASSLT
jgi:hypothetical protein